VKTVDTKVTITTQDMTPPRFSNPPDAVPLNGHTLNPFFITWTYTLSAWGSSRSTVVISSTVPKHFVHQFNTFVDLLKGYIGKPYLSLSLPQFGHILL
jgi:hypothetical protein